MIISRNSINIEATSIPGDDQTIFRITFKRLFSR